MSWSYRFVHWRHRHVGEGNSEEIEEGYELAEVYWHDGDDGKRARGWTSAKFGSDTPDGPKEIRKLVEKALSDAEKHPIIKSWEIE